MIVGKQPYSPLNKPLPINRPPLNGRETRSDLLGAVDTLHRMAMVVQLPDHVAAAAAERVACRRALESFIGGADKPDREPIDIHRAREQFAEELMTEYQAISKDFTRGCARASEESRGLG